MGPKPNANAKVTEAQAVRQSLGNCQDAIEALNAESLAVSYAKVAGGKKGPDVKSAEGLIPTEQIVPWGDPVVGVIIETRPHLNLPYVVDQACRLGLRVQLFHSDANESFIRGSKLSRWIDSGQVVLTKLPTADLNLHLYNGILLSDRFWEQMMGRGHILLFQCDTVFCDRSPYKVDDFRDFDYIGPAWKQRFSLTLRAAGGIGGFTLRSWRKSVDAIRQFDPLMWPAGEDRYFAFHLELVGARVAMPEECDEFCSQHGWTRRSLGAHKLNGLRRADLLRFLAYCPAAWRVIGRIERARRDSHSLSALLQRKRRR